LNLIRLDYHGAGMRMSAVSAGGKMSLQDRWVCDDDANKEVKSELRWVLVYASYREHGRKIITHTAVTLPCAPALLSHHHITSEPLNYKSVEFCPIL
jgi:hypothetical protein